MQPCASYEGPIQAGTQDTSQTCKIAIATEDVPLRTTLPTPFHSLPESLVPPFVFSLQNDADIWRAYVKSQLPASHKSLPARLLKLADKMGCTYAQIKGQLSELMNLHLGLTVQCHTSGRPFTPTEDSIIAEQLWTNSTTTTTTTNNSNNNNDSADRLVEVAAQLRCTIGAVAVRSRQLKTFRVIDAVHSRLQANQNKHKHATAQVPVPPLQSIPKLDSATKLATNEQLDDRQYNINITEPSALGKRSNTEIYNNNSAMPAQDVTINSKSGGTKFEGDSEELSAHFSTEEDASDD